MLLSLVDGQVRRMIPSYTDADIIIDTLSEGIRDTLEYTKHMSMGDDDILIPMGTEFLNVSNIIHSYDTAVAISDMNLDTPFVAIWESNNNPYSEEYEEVFISGPGGREGLNRMSVEQLSKKLYSSVPITIYDNERNRYMGMPRMGLPYADVDHYDDLIDLFDPSIRLYKDRGNDYNIVPGTDISEMFVTNIPYDIHIIRRGRRYMPVLDVDDEQVVETYRVKGIIEGMESTNLQDVIRHIEPNIFNPYTIRPISRFSDVDIIFN